MTASATLPKPCELLWGLKKRAPKHPRYPQREVSAVAWQLTIFRGGVRMLEPGDSRIT